MKFYEISKELERVLEECEGGISSEAEEGKAFNSSELLSRISALEGSYNDKVEGMLTHILNLELEVQVCDSELARLKKRKERAEAKLEGYQMTLETWCGDGGVYGARELKWKTNPPKVDILVEEDKIPPQYMRESVKVTTSPDKKLIKQDILAKADISFARLIQTKSMKVK
jgi:hypothetical protein